MVVMVLVMLTVVVVVVVVVMFCLGGGGGTMQLFSPEPHRDTTQSNTRTPRKEMLQRQPRGDSPATCHYKADQATAKGAKHKNSWWLFRQDLRRCAFPFFFTKYQVGFYLYPPPHPHPFSVTLGYSQPLPPSRPPSRPPSLSPPAPSPLTAII